MPTTIKANRLMLNRSNELIYDRGNTWCPMGSVSVGELLEVLDERGADEIEVTFRTYSEKTAEQDKKTYARRMSKLQTSWTFSGWEPRVIDGHVMAQTFVGTLKRNA